MLKTSSTETAEPKKGVVGVGGGGRNKTESIGKHEADRVDNGGGCSGDFDRRFHLELYGDFDVTFQVTHWRSGHYSFASQ